MKTNLISLQERIANPSDWLIQNSGAVPYIIGFGMRQWTSGVYKRYPSNPLITFCGIRYTKSGSEIQFLADKHEYRQSAKKLFDDVSLLETIYADFLNDEKVFQRFIQGIETNGESYLHERFQEFVACYDAEYISSAVPDGILVYGEEMVAEMRKTYPGHETEIATLAKMYGESFLGAYRKGLFKIALEIKNKDGESISEKWRENKEIQTMIDQLYQQFFWMRCNYKNVEAMPEEEIITELRVLLKKEKKELSDELKELVENVDRHQESCDSIRLSGIFSPTDYQKLWWLGQIAWWTDRRKKYNLQANYYLGRHLKWLAEKHHLIYDDIVFLLPWELDAVIAGKKNLSDFPIEERKRESIHFYDVHDQEIFPVGEEAKTLWKTISPPIEQDLKELKGNSAERGVVRGIVRIVMDAHNIERFDDGDILVTGMTRPDFISLMKKASAIVTDEGGITCHAAIVSRELKKPCIIGTKIATKVLKNGYMVEVDANNGIVKIL